MPVLSLRLGFFSVLFHLTGKKVLGALGKLGLASGAAFAKWFVSVLAGLPWGHGFLARIVQVVLGVVVVLRDSTYKAVCERTMFEW